MGCECNGHRPDPDRFRDDYEIYPEGKAGGWGRLERTSAKIECLAKEILEVSSVTQLTCTRFIGIPELIEGCILDHFSEERVSFDLQIATAVPPVEADFLKLDRVFLNLFRNAREAGANRILVRITASPERLSISVEDDGEGCSAEQIGKLFRPLYTTRKTKGGTGLGLYIVKAILDSHGGGIRAESKIGSKGRGSGMIFTLELPITQSRSGSALGQDTFRMSKAEDGQFSSVLGRPSPFRGALGKMGRPRGFELPVRHPKIPGNA
jgi:histidine kinase/DNA gyrase B/HSP90-like ATPase